MSYLCDIFGLIILNASPWLTLRKLNLRNISSKLCFLSLPLTSST